MSGHSKWSTIKRQKAINDNARGKVFSKLSRAISIAVKTGGGPDPDSNYKLRLMIDAARASNMPKDNIERAISKASSEAGNMDEVVYEGFGPYGVPVIVDGATDNRNRTGQEIKRLFEKGGGSFGGPGSVAFHFETRGYIFVHKKVGSDEDMLSIIDAGVDDVSEGDNGYDVYVSVPDLTRVKNTLVGLGLEVADVSIIKKPISPVKLSEEQRMAFEGFLTSLEDHDDVQNVWVGAE